MLTKFFIVPRMSITYTKTPCKYGKNTFTNTALHANNSFQTSGGWVIPFDRLCSIIFGFSDGKLPHLLLKNEMNCYLMKMMWLIKLPDQLKM